MENLPSLEMLESVHDFPGIYMFKVIGKVEDAFVARVVTAVREELQLPMDPPFTLRQTASGRHVAITLEPTVQASTDVIAVYRRVRQIEGLVMLC